MQKKFIDRSKQKIMKPGWILIHQDMNLMQGAAVKATVNANINIGDAYLLDLFSDSYDHEDALVFGPYKAFRFTPK